MYWKERQRIFPYNCSDPFSSGSWVTVVVCVWEREKKSHKIHWAEVREMGQGFPFVWEEEEKIDTRWNSSRRFICRHLWIWERTNERAFFSFLSIVVLLSLDFILNSSLSHYVDSLLRTGLNKLFQGKEKNQTSICLSETRCKVQQLLNGSALKMCFLRQFFGCSPQHNGRSSAHARERNIFVYRSKSKHFLTL